jgi:hypothetical protein
VIYQHVANALRLSLAGSLTRCNPEGTIERLAGLPTLLCIVVGFSLVPSSDAPLRVTRDAIYNCARHEVGNAMGIRKRGI